MKRFIQSALIIFIVAIFFLLSFLYHKNSIQLPKTVKAEPPGGYFKDWYYPYNAWTPEMQRQAVEEISQTPDEQSLTVIDKNGKIISAAFEPWVQKGPFGIEHNSSGILKHYSGRVTSLDYYPGIGLYLGSGNGGLWRQSDDFFNPISDKVPALTVGGFAVNPTDPNMIFLGTGEYREVITLQSDGAGVFKTTNGGQNWELINMPANFSRVAKVVMQNNLLFVVGNGGISRSTDYGNSWNKLVHANCCDIAIGKNLSYILIGVTEQGIWKSTDQGLTKTKIPCKLFPGLDSTKIGRIVLAISPSVPARAYVQFGNPADRGKVLGVYRTDDSGKSWTNITPADPKFSTTSDYLSQQGYNNVILVHPTNQNIVWAGGIFLIRSSNGGTNWTSVGNNPQAVHPDIHALLYVNSMLYVGCDGGVFFTDDEGSNWNSSMNKVLPITQFYNIAVEMDGGELQCGGTQDNGNVATSIANPNKWVMKRGGDGIDAAIDQIYPANYYFTHNGGEWRTRTINDGINWSGIDEPMRTNQDDAQSFWHTYISVSHSSIFGRKLFTNAGSYIYWSSNNGDSWSRMGSYQSFAPVGRPTARSDGNFVYLPVNDIYQRVAGFTFNLSTQSWTMNYISNGLPDKLVKRVCLGTLTIDRAYALLYGIGDDKKIYKTTNNGINWYNITGNLPDVPVNALIEYGGKVYLGTDRGAFISTITNETNWVRWNKGMPVATQILDMELMQRDGTWYIVAGTFSRSTFERPVLAIDPVFSTLKYQVNLGSVLAGNLKLDSIKVFNRGENSLIISGIRSIGSEIRVSPPNATINPGDSIKFILHFIAPVGVPNLFQTAIEFDHNAADSPSRILLECYIGDGTKYRTFCPESLIIKKEVKRKAVYNNWRFTFNNDYSHRNPPKALYVEFKKPVIGFKSHQPFKQTENIDGRGYIWKFTDGFVNTGSSAEIWCFTKKSHKQLVKKWWWLADNVVWEGEFEGTEEGILGNIKGIKHPDWQAFGFGLPNTANLRKEVFSSYPFNRTNPLIIGVADPNARTRQVAYVAFAKHGDLYGSLTPGRSGKRHDGPPRRFDSFDNNKKMLGAIKKLTPDKQSNRLFAELIAFKLNLYASDIGITPPFKEEVVTQGTNSFSKPMGVEPTPWRSLRYLDVGHTLHNMHLHEIDSLANVYMTYGDSSSIGSAVALYSVLYKINRAFVGPLDTVSFASRLVLTGVRPIAEVPFLERDTSYRPIPRSLNQIASTIPDEFELYQNYPNPFNPTTTIEFYLPISATVTLKVYDILGREVKTLLDRQAFDEGGTEIEFDATRFASGVYFYRIVTEGIDEDGEQRQSFTSVQKMLMIK
ncbi:MAG: T9SS type A sorting domain-containing protein [Bacteroidota bacterium]|nr:T9SS type A sorting domain-containing protein [Bacteroidota bacterium]